MGKDLTEKELGTGLSQRKDKRYIARYVNRYGKRMQKYNNNLGVVKKWLVNVKYEDEHGLLGSGDRATVDEWFEIWIKTYKEGVVRHNTLKNYKNRYKFDILPTIGKLQLRSVKKIQLQ